MGQLKRVFLHIVVMLCAALLILAFGTPLFAMVGITATFPGAMSLVIVWDILYTASQIMKTPYF